MASGQIYVPKIVIKELNDIKRNKKIDKNAEAFRELVNYSKIGREVERISPLMHIKDLKSKGKKRRGGFFGFL